MSVNPPKRPKYEIIIDNGVFEIFVWFFVKHGLCHQKEKIQAQNPNATVRYIWETFEKQL